MFNLFRREFLWFVGNTLDYHCGEITCFEEEKKKKKIPGVIDEISSEAKKGILQLLMNSLYWKKETNNLAVIGDLSVI